MSNGFDELCREASGDFAVTGHAKGYGKRTALAATIALTLAPGLAGALDLVAPGILTEDQDYSIQDGVTVSGDNGLNSVFFIGIDGFAPYSGTLSNAGEIQYQGTDSGSALYMASHLAGSLINSGNIVAEVGGIYSVDASAIALPGGSLSVATLLNEGTVAATAKSDEDSASARGVFVYAMHGAFTNSATGHISAQASGQSAQAYGSVMLFSSGGLANAGAITATAAGSSAAAYGLSSLASSGDITHTGTIAAQASGTSYSEAYGLFSLRSFGSLSSTGSITATASGSDAGAFALVALNSTGDFTNTGSLMAEASGDTSANAYGFVALAAAGDLVNTGTITAEASGPSATAFGAYLSDFVSFENLGSITASAEGGEGYSIVAVGDGATINNRAGGVLDGKLEIVGAGNRVNNAGLIHLPHSIDSAGGNESLIAGDYQQAATGQLAIAAYGTGDDEYSRLWVSGDVTLDPGTAAAVDVRAGNTGATRLAIGETLTGVVVADGELTGNFSKVTDNSSLFNFRSLAYQGAGGSIDFEILPGVTAVKSALATDNRMALGAAAVFDGIIVEGEADGEMQDVVDALGSLETEQEVSDALSQTLPLLSASLSQATENALRGTSRVIRERQGLLQGRSSGDGFLGDEQLWMKAFGGWADQDDREGVSGYDADTSGFVLGSDAALSAVDRLGLAFAYARSDVNGNSSVARQSAKVDSFLAMLYGSHDLSEATVLDYQLDAGRHNNEGQRDIDFGGLQHQAEADYSSWSAHAGAALSHRLQWTEQTRFIPALRLDYSWMRDEAYDEKGAAALNLEVDDNRTEALILGVDGQLDHALSERLSLSAKLGLGYDLINDQASLTSAFAGAPTASFVTRGLDPSPWVKTAGLGLSYRANEQTELSAAYDLEGREDFLNQTASVKVRWAF